MRQLVKMESCFIVMNDVLVFINPCSAIEYWKACDEIISKGEIVKQKKVLLKQARLNFQN